MPVAVIATRISRRLLDVLIILVLALVLATLVIGRIIPLITGGATFVVGGGSMAPAIPFGSAVIAVPVTPAELRPGDVVSLRVGPQRAVFTHRITRIVTRDDGLWLETRGDANAEPDPSLMPSGAVIGRVAIAIPFAGYLVMLLGSIRGIVFVVSLAGFLVAGAWLLETVESERRARLHRRAAAALVLVGPDPVTGRGAAG